MPEPGRIRGTTVAQRGVADAMGFPRFGIVAGATTSAAFIVASCGSTSPVAPTSVSGASQYPSLLGHYVSGADLRLQYRDTGATVGWICTTMADISTQKDGIFSGGFGFTGGGSREPPCTGSFAFTAEIRPDGTITNFEMNGGSGLGGCTSVSDKTISGTATHAAIDIVISDLATCLDWRVVRRDLVPRQNADRSVIISVKRLRD